MPLRSGSPTIDWSLSIDPIGVINVLPPPRPYSNLHGKVVSEIIGAGGAWRSFITSVSICTCTTSLRGVSNRSEVTCLG